MHFGKSGKRGAKYFFGNVKEDFSLMCKEKIIISSCMCGNQVRYNGSGAGNLIVENNIVKKWHQENRLILVCPELLAGLTTPRPAAEIFGCGGESVFSGQGKVVSQDGQDFTDDFIQGVIQALKIVKLHNVKLAILKDYSPSCGTENIHDGSFLKRTYYGLGVTAALLAQNNVRLFNASKIDLAADYLKAIE